MLSLIHLVLPGQYKCMNGMVLHVLPDIYILQLSYMDNYLKTSITRTLLCTIWTEGYRLGEKVCRENVYISILYMHYIHVYACMYVIFMCTVYIVKNNYIRTDTHSLPLLLVYQFEHSF